MNRRALTLSIPLALLVAAGSAGAAAAAGPVREGDAYSETFEDEFIRDLCGIETLTTVTERWTRTLFPDGSETLHATRTFVPHDPRIPVEKGAGTTFIAPDGTRRVVGKPLHLFDPDGGVRILDAGWVEFGSELTVRGPHPSLDADLVALYCP